MATTGAKVANVVIGNCGRIRFALINGLAVAIAVAIAVASAVAGAVASAVAVAGTGAFGQIVVDVRCGVARIAVLLNHPVNRLDNRSTSGAMYPMLPTTMLDRV
ncbi:hypothetical protein GQ42DRAFT_154904 [Ramicandelaber brevisporus]|nr:hypothetical protein GQ42DRAFT_154904 [Ramicandelaber brevisporus]